MSEKKKKADPKPARRKKSKTCTSLSAKVEFIFSVLHPSEREKKASASAAPVSLHEMRALVTDLVPPRAFKRWEEQTLRLVIDKRIQKEVSKFQADNAALLAGILLWEEQQQVHSTHKTKQPTSSSSSFSSSSSSSSSSSWRDFKFISYRNNLGKLFKKLTEQRDMRMLCYKVGDTVFLGCQRSGSSLEWEPKMGILLENKCCAAYERPRQITPDRVKESNTLVSLYDGYALVCCETDARDAATQDLLEITCGRTEGYKHFQASVGGCTKIMYAAERDMSSGKRKRGDDPSGVGPLQTQPPVRVSEFDGVRAIRVKTPQVDAMKVKSALEMVYWDIEECDVLYEYSFERDRAPLKTLVRQLKRENYSEDEENFVKCVQDFVRLSPRA